MIFFIWLSRFVTLYNIVQKSLRRWKIFYTILYKLTKRLSQIKNPKFPSLVFQTLPNAKCHECLNSFSYFGLGHLITTTTLDWKHCHREHQKRFSPNEQWAQRGRDLSHSSPNTYNRPHNLKFHFMTYMNIVVRVVL